MVMSAQACGRMSIGNRLHSRRLILTFALSNGILTEADNANVKVVKNRYDGELGAMTLKFDKESLGYTGSESKPKNKKKANSEKVYGETESISDISETVEDL